MELERGNQKMICKHISKYYPDVIFTSDQSGLFLSRHSQRNQLMTSKSSRGIPDLIVLHPAGGCHGLMLEIKQSDVAIFRRDGALVADKHIHQQYEILMSLRAKGYAAFFVCGLDAGVGCIENYMSGQILLDSFKRSTVSEYDTTIQWSGGLKLL